MKIVLVNFAKTTSTLYTDMAARLNGAGYVVEHVSTRKSFGATLDASYYNSQNVHFIFFLGDSRQFSFYRNTIPRKLRGKVTLIVPYQNKLPEGWQTYCRDAIASRDATEISMYFDKLITAFHYAGQLGDGAFHATTPETYSDATTKVAVDQGSNETNSLQANTQKSKAQAKAEKKMAKAQKKVAKAQKKANKAQAKAEKKMANAVKKKDVKKASKALVKANEVQEKANLVKRKVNKKLLALGTEN